MKKLLLILLLSPLISHAQVGWHWGAGATTYGTAATSLEGFLVAPDRGGGAYVAPTTLPGVDSASFGSFVLYNPENSLVPLYIARVDSAGNYVWAMSSSNTEAYASGITSDNDGNLYVFGVYSFGTLNIGSITLPNPGTSDMVFLLKIAPSGTVLWSKSVSGLSSVDNYGSICLDAYGNSYITGSFYGNITIGTTTLINKDPTGSTMDIFLAKFNSNGSFIWAKSFGTGGNDGLIAVTAVPGNYIYFEGGIPADSVITLGTTLLNGPGNTFYAKADTGGNIEWAYSMPANVVPKGITTDAWGNLYTTGYYFGTDTFGASVITSVGGVDMFISKSDTAGNFIWGNSAGGNVNDEGYSITADLCGKLWVSGSMGWFPTDSGYVMYFNTDSLVTPSASFDPLFVAEYDTAGNYIGGMTFPSGGDDEIGIVADDKGSFFLCGDNTSAAVVFGTDTTTRYGGKSLHSKVYL